MSKILCALLVLRVATGHSIITKSMLYGVGESSLEPVQLATKPPEAVTERLSRIRQTPKELLRSLGYIGSEDHFEGRQMLERNSDIQDLPGEPTEDDEPVTERLSRIRQTPKELLRSLGYIKNEEDFEGRNTSEDYLVTQDPSGESTDDDYYYTDATPTPYTTSMPEQPTKVVQIARREQTAVTESSKNRTKLYPVGRLWERTMPPRPMPGFMAILDAMFSCMWSGLGFECFSLKVVPMFRAMMGFPPVNPFGHPYYVLPRTSDVAESKKDEDDEQGRRRRRRFWGLKIVKGAMIGLAAVKTLVLPALSVLSIMSGKAIIFSLAAVILTVAAGWSTAKSADRRVYNTQPSDTPYYMM
ncbi:hypothetical protein GE061_015616 [Apolygus lucorum]|uniref:Uncharacterized protein n=1 Tax=Apolygus lucorum TaxID=248454 RepID=A0A8S9XLN2_APOLU|nr:hypothetical protein GE061_015616 [Apolygus lucorum]